MRLVAALHPGTGLDGNESLTLCRPQVLFTLACDNLLVRMPFWFSTSHRCRGALISAISVYKCASGLQVTPSESQTSYAEARTIHRADSSAGPCI